ncbi:NAD(P)H-dependent oxidoreductase [Noviherbaspirillum denitrificans]|uniref:NADPH-dependent FMN reductase n=1 Tax=Noviherbaspirillum denitrificans TaxID=1968433 RepID=A0A254TF95_9BURK|nr:NAD(P)H-dependent oxidoreductase [Noviherbaspirillum denitrificans]OWW20827.1 NADPH-dependent FMN reductase [Noviherbaspirillum denitrificans]
MKKIVALTGSLSKPSRTRSLVEHIAEQVAQHVPARISVIDIADLAGELGDAVSFSSIPASITRAHKQIAEADLVILGSPTYKGSYSGLLKHFLDLLDPAALKGKVTLLTATGGSDRHALVIEHQFRPLASFFETVTVPAGVYIKDSDFVNYALAEGAEQAHKRIELAVEQAVGLLAAREPVALAA